MRWQENSSIRQAHRIAFVNFGIVSASFDKLRTSVRFANVLFCVLAVFDSIFFLRKTTTVSSSFLTCCQLVSTPKYTPLSQSFPSIEQIYFVAFNSDFQGKITWILSFRNQKLRMGFRGLTLLFRVLSASRAARRSLLCVVGFGRLRKNRVPFSGTAP